MTKIKPFKAFIYNRDKIKDLSAVVCPPYDIISPEDQRYYHERNQYNLIHILLGNDVEGQDKYQRSADYFRDWLKNRIIIQEEKPAAYFYSQDYNIRGEKRTRLGFISLLRLGEDCNSVFGHENTHAAPKEDRLKILKRVKANLSPIFAIFLDKKRIIQRIYQKDIKGKEPFICVTDSEKTVHKIWRIDSPEELLNIQSCMEHENIFIADGHHRYETAIAYRDWMKKQFPHSTDDAAFNYVMMFFGEMSDPGLIILPTHRVLQNWPGFDAGNFKERLKEFFDFKTFAKDRKEAFLSELSNLRDRRAIGILFPQEPGHHLIIPKPAAFQSIDTAILHQTIFRDVLKFKDEDEKDPRHLRFIKEMEEGFEALKDPQVNCVFLMNCPRMEDLRKVVESGQILPPKTTYFYPKLITGLVMNQIDPRDSVVI